MAKNPRANARQWRTGADGKQEVQCSCCQAFKPATKEHFFFQGKNGCKGPHSWCKPCYATNMGRAPGMRVTALPEVEPAIAYVAPAFGRGPLLPSVGMRVAPALRACA